MNLLLTSSFPLAKNDASAEIIHDFTNKPKVLFIGYSSNAKKYIKVFERYSLKHIDFLNLGKGSVPENISDYNIVMMFGGNPSTIKKHIVDTQLDTLINENSLVVTTSGSTCVYSKSFTLLNSFYPAWKNMDTIGLNYFPYEILPHFQRYKKKKIEDYALHNKVYALTDGTAISYIRNKIELIGDVKIL